MKQRQGVARSPPLRCPPASHVDQQAEDAATSPNARRRDILMLCNRHHECFGASQHADDVQCRRGRHSDPLLHRRDNSHADEEAANRTFGVRERRRSGRARGEFHPTNRVLHNGLATHRHTGTVSGTRAATDTAADTAFAALHHRCNQSTLQATRAYRAEVALATGIDPAAAAAGGRYTTRSSGWRYIERGADADAAMGPLFVSVGRRLCVRDAPVPPLSAVARASLQREARAAAAAPAEARRTWTRTEPSPRRSSKDRSATPPRKAAAAVACSPPAQPSARAAAHLRRTLLSGRGERHDTSGGGGAPERHGTPRDIMEAALASRLGVGVAHLTPSAIDPAQYRVPADSSSSALDVSSDVASSARNAECAAATTARAGEEDDQVTSTRPRRGGMEGTPWVVRAPDRLSSPSSPRSCQEGQSEPRGQAAAQRLLLFAPLMTPLLEEVNQCLYEHQLGSLLEIWRAGRREQDKVLACVGFTPREREIILWELSRMIRNTSTQVAVAM